MKPKRITKKLVLNKTTLTNLENSGMDKVRGGVYTVPGYQTIEKICFINSCVNCTWPC